MASAHVFQGASPAEVCAKNAEAARKQGRADHVQFFGSMRLLLEQGVQEPWGASPLARSMIREMYAELAVEKDIQLLAIFAVLLLSMYRPALPRTLPSPRPLNVHADEYIL